MSRSLAVPLLLLMCGAAAADESVRVCYNYGCASEATVTFSEARLAMIRDALAATRDAVGERKRLAAAVGRLYAWAGEQTPIWRDKGGNYADDGVDGKMDCIDHSTTTTRFLRLLERRGWLRFHRVQAPALRRRWLISEHRSAVVEEIGATGPQRFVIDSWYVDNGEPAVVMPLEDWMNGDGPHE